MKTPIFEVKPIFRPNDEQVEEIIKKIAEKIRTIVGDELTKYEVCLGGQGTNFKIYVNRNNKPSYLLRVLVRKGYPDIKKLDEIYALLSKHKIPYREVIYTSSSSDIAPYGVILQRWIDGEDAISRKGVDWIDDIKSLLINNYNIKSDYYSSSDWRKRYFSGIDYVKSIAYEVEHSFGDVFYSPVSLFAFEEYEIVPSGTMNKVLTRLEGIAVSLDEEYKPVLVHGDILPGNILYKTKNEINLIDWDEARFVWWPYDVARTSFYIKDFDVIKRYIDSLGNYLPINKTDVLKIVSIEHARQRLRTLLFLGTKSWDENELKIKVESILEEITNDIFNRVKI